MELQQEGRFDTWNIKKKSIDKNAHYPQFKEREIFHARIGHNVGFEQNGKNADFARPVLILKKFNPYIFWGIPLSTSQKEGKYYFRFNFRDDFQSNALLSQIRLFDGKRLLNKIGVISKPDFQLLQEKLADLMRPIRTQQAGNLLPPLNSMITDEKSRPEGIL